MHYRIHLFITLVLSFITHVHAQEGRLLSVEEDISSSMITQLYQDKEGIIWISTEDGLNRYDGAKFTIIGKEGNSHLLSNHVRRTFEDSRNRFFIATLNGVQLYDRAIGEFTTIPIYLPDGKSIHANTTSVIERSNGEIWIGTSGYGIFKLNEENGKLFFTQQQSDSSNLLIDNIFEDSKGRLWLLSPSCIYQIKNEKHINSYLEGGLSENFTSFCEDNSGNLYVGSRHSGMFLYDEEDDSFHSIPYHQKLTITDLYLANQEEIYLGTDGNGVKIYNIREKKIKDSNFNITTLDFSKAKVHSLIKDNQGNTWIGCFQKGVIIIPAITNGFNYIGYKSVTSNSIGSCCVMAICRDHEGLLWIGTDGDGIYVTYPNGKQKAHYPNLSGKENCTVMSIFEDSNHQIWAGTYQYGLFKIDRTTGQSKQMSLPDSTSQDKPRIYSIIEDKNKRLWMASMGSGIYQIDMNTLDVTLLPSYNGDLDPDIHKNALFNNWVNCVYYSSDNKLYFGTYNGFGCMDINTHDFVSTYGVNQFLQGEVVCAIYEDKEKNIWIGTHNGLKKFNTQTKEFKSFTTEDGLPSNSIAAIKGDENNNLWISTNYGISRFHIQSENIVSFYTRDGLQGNEFTKGAAFQGIRGDINFGGPGGVTFFNPQEIINPSKKPQIKISDFYVHDKAIHKGVKSGKEVIIDTNVSKAKEFHLSHLDNSFSIEFTAMEYYNPERITYQYNFNGNGWITLRNGENHVSFSDLEPNIYHLQVRAKDYNTYSDTIEVSIIISPPWYATGWAKLLYTMVACILVIAISLQIRHRFRARQQMLEHKHAEEINEAKLQFFINISHEIRTPMSLIISPLQKLIATDSDKDRQQNYNMIYRNAERILQLINQLMDIRKIGKGKMELKFKETNIVEFIKDFYDNFNYYAKTKDISIEYTCDFEELLVYIDPKNFDKIIFNLLSNALKYTPRGGHIQIQLQTGNNPVAATKELQNYLEINVIDNGIGLEESEINRIFDRFYQIRNGENNSSTGTGIGLHLTRSLVELHHGEISAKNNEGGTGSCFTIRIPLGKEHLRAEEIDYSEDIKQAKPHSIKEKEEEVRLIVEENTSEKLKSKSKFRVVIVEDDEEIRRYLYNELGNNFHIQEFNNGKDALSSILKKAPDLVITDVMMPEMDGMTLCKKIKQNVNINHIPVVMLTAKTREEDTVEGLMQGADAYITKPFNIEVLKQTVHNLIKGRELLKNNFSGKQVQEEKIKKIEAESPDERLLNRVMKVINENIGNADLNVEMIANEVGISRVHLHRKLKELTSQSTRDFIRNIRLKQAASLLAKKKHSVAEVASLTGFNNLTYFSTVFKESYGVSPSSYMNQHLEEQEEG